MGLKVEIFFDNPSEKTSFTLEADYPQTLYATSPRGITSPSLDLLPSQSGGQIVEVDIEKTITLPYFEPRINTKISSYTRIYRDKIVVVTVI